MFPILFRAGGVSIATYGLLVALGWLAAISWLWTRRGDIGLTEDEFWSLIWRVFFGAILGGKILFLIVEWQSLASGAVPWTGVLRYGFVFFGGLCGAILMLWLYARTSGKRFMLLADHLGTALPMGHAVGRLGCLAAGCCYGLPTSLPWGVRFTDPYSLVAPSLLGIPLHPTQLYEAGADVLIALALTRVLRKIRGGGLPEGTACLGYLILYSAARFAIEFYRGDDRGGFLAGMSPSQWIALAVLAAAGPVLWRQFKRSG